MKKYWRLWRWGWFYALSTILVYYFYHLIVATPVALMVNGIFGSDDVINIIGAGVCWFLLGAPLFGFAYERMISHTAKLKNDTSSQETIS